MGGSVDRACKLEALLRLLSSRRRELRSEQMRVDNQFISLMNELQHSLTTDEDLTVIAADTFSKPRSDGEKDGSAGDHMLVEVRDNESSGHPLGSEQRAIGEDTTPLKPRPTTVERPITPPGDTTRGFFCSGTDVFDTMMPLGVTTPARQNPPGIPGSVDRPRIVRSLSHSHPSPSALRAGARAWREMHGRPPSEAIDFRTGLSGHSALLSTSYLHPHDYLDPPRAGVAEIFRGMSNHTGLTMWKPVKRQLSAGSPSREEENTVGSRTISEDER